jgi:hypothetical protein
MASTPAQIRHLVDRAIRIAKAERTVTCIIIPNDVQEMPAVETPPRKHGTVHSGIGYMSPRVAARRRASFQKRKICRKRRMFLTPEKKLRCWSALARSRQPTKSSKLRMFSVRA